MKHISKQGSPARFEAWKSSKNQYWEPSYNNLQNPEKSVLHQALVEEQGWVCCYCGRGITLADSHVEHFRPQESYPDLALDFTNLHASCIRETKPGAPLHCGHAKGPAFDEAKHISPLDPDCEQRFIYAFNGAILAAVPTDAAANYMLSLLRLDIAFVRTRRQQVLESVFDPEFIQSATAEELLTLAGAFRARPGDRALDEFGHVVALYAEQLARKLT